MTPIENAARAMHAQTAPEWSWDDPDAELLRRLYRANARAALLSLRDPTDSMCEAGGDHVAQADRITVDAIWTVMMDAALVQDV
ncbi:hypothetical protein [Sphingobium algorifonticola]|uniref:Uncharacterized protein n=1 Tax=Sphingobium algorifonticola TaxID=2008318 RepID=A0A437JDW0_9SPHN|nr:hypothetical protein [Sphingobium algorifonticola]RVT43802.1 hypothetical protein ENE74_04175 [Sphingobium algorifonticola]